MQNLYTTEAITDPTFLQEKSELIQEMRMLFVNSFLLTYAATPINDSQSGLGIQTKYEKKLEDKPYSAAIAAKFGPIPSKENYEEYTKFIKNLFLHDAFDGTIEEFTKQNPPMVLVTARNKDGSLCGIAFFDTSEYKNKNREIYAAQMAVSPWKSDICKALAKEFLQKFPKTGVIYIIYRPVNQNAAQAWQHMGFAKVTKEEEAAYLAKKGYPAGYYSVLKQIIPELMLKNFIGQTFMPPPTGIEQRQGDVTLQQEFAPR